MKQVDNASHWRGRAENIKNKMAEKKPTLGVMSFTSCSGCQIAVLNLEELLADLMGNFNIKYFHLIQARNNEVPVDVAIVEGAITTKEQEKKLKEIRKNCKVLIAMGSCACTGGIPAMKNKDKRDTLAKEVYTSKTFPKSIKAQGVDKFVEVDYYIRGCPITKEEFAETVIEVLEGKRPFHRPYPVCTECKMNENACLLMQGKICLGPITFMGCKAPCPTNGEECIGCRDFFEDSRITAYINLLKEMGFKSQEIINVFDKFLQDRYSQDEIRKLVK